MGSIRFVQGLTGTRAERKRISTSNWSTGIHCRDAELGCDTGCPLLLALVALLPWAHHQWPSGRWLLAAVAGGGRRRAAAAGGMTNPCREPAPLRLLLLAAVAEDERATSVPWWAPTVDWGPDLDLAVTLTLARRRETAVRGATSRIRAIPAGGHGSRGPPPPPRTRRPSGGPSAGRLHGGGEPLPALLPWPLTPV